MRLLLDTHVLLWWMTNDPRLPGAVREVLQSDENDVAVSAVSVWEVAIKRALGRIDADVGELIDAITVDGFSELPVRIRHAEVLQGLPRQHDDPFDRMLIAQSIADDRRLVTHDGAILQYAGVSAFDPLRA